MEIQSTVTRFTIENNCHFLRIAILFYEMFQLLMIYLFNAPSILFQMFNLLFVRLSMY